MRRKYSEETDIEPVEPKTVSDKSCSIPASLTNDIIAIGRIDNKDFCKVNEEALAYYVSKRKLRDECQAGVLSSQDCRCAEY